MAQVNKAPANTNTESYEPEAKSKKLNVKMKVTHTSTQLSQSANARLRASSNLSSKQLSGKTAAGFSLIELMLALALGLVVTAGIVQLFVGNNRTNQLITGQSRLQESARYALDFVSRSVRNGGFYGCDPENDKVYNTLNASWSQMFELDITVPVAGFDGTGNGNGVGDWSPSLATLPRGTGGTTIVPANGIDITTLVPLSDILVVRYQVAPGYRITEQIDPNDDPVIENNGDVDFAAGDYAVISNCEQAAIFQVTGLAGGANMTLARNTGTGTYQNRAGVSLSAQGVPYGNDVDNQGSVVARLNTDIFFVAESANENNRGDAISSLWRKSGIDAPVELVEGISDLQILFGVDTTPNDTERSANRYVPFGSVGSNAVRSVRVSIEANTVDVVSDSPEPISRTFTQTISIRNS